MNNSKPQLLLTKEKKNFLERMKYKKSNLICDIFFNELQITFLPSFVTSLLYKGDTIRLINSVIFKKIINA